MHFITHEPYEKRPKADDAVHETYTNTHTVVLDSHGIYFRPMFLCCSINHHKYIDSSIPFWMDPLGIHSILGKSNTKLFLKNEKKPIYICSFNGKSRSI